MTEYSVSSDAGAARLSFSALIYCRKLCRRCAFRCRARDEHAIAFANMRKLAVLILLLLALSAIGQTNTALDQIPDLKELPDSTAALQKRIDDNGGNLRLGDDDKILRITKPLVFDLKKHGAIAVKADGGATIVMDGPGPALKLIGSHEGSASPTAFKAATWNERMPIVSGIRRPTGWSCFRRSGRS
jgi:hypothetical protein